MSTKAIVILEGRGGELDRAEIEVDAEGEDAEAPFNEAVQDQIELWILSPGDTIKIVEHK